MKKIINDIKHLLTSIGTFIFNILSSILLPFIDTMQEFTNIFFNILDLDFKLLNKIVRKVNSQLKNKVHISLILYYIFLFCLEIYILFEILGGKIMCYDFLYLFSYSVIFILYSIIFVVFLNKRFKSRNFNYVIYFQLLFLLPLGVVYWIATIEGHNIYLKDLNSDQWISLFNTIIIYFSGCLIGIITLYKNNSEANKKCKK